MKPLILLLVCVAIVAGCRKRPESKPSPVVTQTEAKEPTLEDLNNALQVWFTAKGGSPKGFEDLVKAGYIAKVPTPPPGRTYVIDAANLRVVLR